MNVQQLGYEATDGKLRITIDLMRDKALKEVIHKCLVQYYHKKVREKNDNTLRLYMKEDEYNEFMDMNGKGTHWKWCLVTLNPREDVTIDQLLKIVEKIVDKKWIKMGVGNVEWRDENGKGMHMHIKITKIDDVTKNFSSVRTEIYNTCQHILGNKQHLNIRFNNGDNPKVFDDYIMGIKKGEHKKNYDYDVQTRAELKIGDPIYFWNKKYCKLNNKLVQ